MSSFFSTVARYVPSAKRSAREDMLTQSFAATLNQAPSLAEALASAWLAPLLFETPDRLGGSAESPATTQERLPSGDRIDLVLAFPRTGRSSQPDWLFWVEIKHRAGLSGPDQLEEYAKQLEEERATLGKWLVFLPPAGYEPGDDRLGFPPDLIETTWQQVGEEIDQWRDSPRELDAVTDWIVDQFVDHLEEEGLYMKNPLTVDDLKALRVADHARPTLAALVENAATKVDEWAMSKPQIAGKKEAWNRSPKRKRSVWPEFYRAHAKFLLQDKGLSSPDPQGDAWLEWNLRVPTGEEDVMLGAGLTVWPDLEKATWKRFHAEDLSRREDHGLVRAFSYKRLADFLQGTPESLHLQQTALVGFVVEAFEAVERALGDTAS